MEVPLLRSHHFLRVSVPVDRDHQKTMEKLGKKAWFERPFSPAGPEGNEGLD